MFNVVQRVVAASLAVACVVVQACAWDYASKVDKMMGTVTRTGAIGSYNSLSLDAPYNGQNTGLLYIRQSSGRPDVRVNIMKGQILCLSVGSGCSVNVRFDDGKASRLSAVGPSDLSSTTFFINDVSRFLAGARKAKKILIQFTVYQKGRTGARI